MAEPTGPVEISWDDTRFTAAFDALLARLQDTAPLMADAAELLLESAQRRFTTGVDPSGTPWAPLRDGSGRTPLTVTGALRDQHGVAHGRDWAEVFATMRYALWQHEGTDPYVILPKAGKALAFGNDVSIAAGPRRTQAGKSVVVRKVEHPGLPARRWLGVSAEDQVALDALGTAYLDLGALADG